MKLNGRYFKYLLLVFSLLDLFVVACSFPKQGAFAADLPPIPPKIYQYFSQTINQLKEAGLVDFAIDPKDGSAQVYVATRCWDPMLPQDKIIFIEMFIGFFHGYNQNRPVPNEVAYFFLNDMATKNLIARAWVKPPPDCKYLIQFFD